MLGELDIHMKKEMSEPLPHTKHQKNNSRWIIDLNRKAETIKLLERNREDYLCNFGRERDFLVKS